jgi:hypothetical protein
MKRIKGKFKEWNEKSKRKEEAKVEALAEHLRRMGLDVTVQSKESGCIDGEEAIMGYVKVANRNIDLVELESRTFTSVDMDGSGFSVDVFRCNFVVQVKVEGLENRLKAEGKPVRKRLLSKEVVDFKWVGLDLAQILNNDAYLKRYFCSLRLHDRFYPWGGSECDLEIVPYREEHCVIIRQKWASQWTANTYIYHGSPLSAFPTIETFEAYDRIAQHIRSVTNGRP